MRISTARPDPQARRRVVRCPVCGAADAAPFRTQDGFTIAACRGCGLRFLDPQPSELEQKALYGPHYFASEDSRQSGYDAYADDAENWRRTFRDRLRDLPGPPGRLLDVGAAAGFFVEQAIAAGWEAIGVEPSEWAAEYARRELGVDVRTGSLESMSLPDSTFDTVTMWEVIEHLPDPARSLREVHRILRPGGWLALSTPDAGSRAARLSGSRWLGWRKVPEHLFFFDRSSLDRLLLQGDFVPRRHRYAPLTVPVGFAVARLASLFGLPGWVRAPRPIATRSVRINPLYDLLVIAERP